MIRRHVVAASAALAILALPRLLLAQAGSPHDISITNDDGLASTTPGSTLAYVLSYANTGLLDATGVALTETVPLHTVFVAAASAADWSCADGSPAGTACTLQIGSLASGGHGTRIFAVTVVDPVPPGANVVTNTATIADDGASGPDPTPDDNTSTDVDVLDAAPDLSITASDGGASTAPGATIVYTLSYTNAGHQHATGVTIEETVPVNAIFDAAASGAGWSCPDASPAGTSCTRAIGLLGVGSVGSVAFGVHVPSPVPAGAAQISNTATIADDGTNGADPTPADNSGSDTTPIDAFPELSLLVSDGGISALQGETIVYTLTFGNGGSRGATGVVLAETVPANTTFRHPGSTPGWNCVPDGSPGATCVLLLGALAGGGASGSVTFAVAVADPLPAGVTQVSNTATIADDGLNGADPVPGNNTGTDTTPVSVPVELQRFAAE